jgi:hypothetical protein
LFQDFGRSRQSIARLANANVNAQLADLQGSHDIFLFVSWIPLLFLEMTFLPALAGAAAAAAAAAFAGALTFGAIYLNFLA